MRKKPTSINPPASANGRGRGKPISDSPKHAPMLDLSEWLPYRLWSTVKTFAECVETYYSVHHKLNRISWNALMVLAFDAPLSAKELGEKGGMDQVSVTRAINLLLSLKYIKRDTDPTDRRRAVLKLSKRGRRAYEDIAPVAKELGDTLFSALSAAERDSLSEMLCKLETKEAEMLEQQQQWRIA